MLLVFSVDRTRFIAHWARSCSNQKENPQGKFRSLRRATAVSPAALDKLFKKSLSKNFVWGAVLKKLEQKLCTWHRSYSSFSFIKVLCATFFQESSRKSRPRVPN
jgi:hypothetical protein